MKGMVAAGDPRSAQAGASMFERGGNAMDASVAAAFASFVVEVCVVNIAGGGYALVAGGDGDGDAAAYDFFCAMPSGQSRCMDFREIWVDFGGDRQAFCIGRGSTAAPGAVAGLCRMLADRGKLPLEVVLEPAIALAQDGFEISANAAYVFDLLSPIYSDTPEIRRLFQPRGSFYREGDWLRQPDLARTLKSLAREGPDLFYRGSMAEALARDHRARGGLIVAEDLRGYRVRRMEPLRVPYREYEVLAPPPSSHGGALVGLTLKLLEAVPLELLRHNEYDHARALAHVLRLAAEARLSWEASDGHDAERARRFLSPAAAAPYIRALQERLAEDCPPPAAVAEGQGPSSTSHISAMDAGGMAVSVTTSTGEGAGYLLGDTGVCLNNVLGEHDLNPDGFHRAKPGQRLASMMCPAILLRDGRPVLAVGSAGSNRLRSAIVQTISNAVDFDFPLDRAVNHARVHYESGALQLERGVSPDTADRLRRNGFQVNLWREKNLFFGGAQAVGRLDGLLSGGADARRGGGVALG